MMQPRKKVIRSPFPRSEPFNLFLCHMHKIHHRQSRYKMIMPTFVVGTIKCTEEIPCNECQSLLWSWKTETPFFGSVFTFLLFHRPTIISPVKSQLSGCEKTKIPLAQTTGIQISEDRYWICIMFLTA